MRKKRIFKNAPQIMTILLYALLFMAVATLMNYVQNLLDSDVQINLTEIVTQNKDVITSKLNLEVNSLDSITSQITDRLKKESKVSADNLENAFINYLKDHDDENLFISGVDGVATFPDGSTLDISGRRYFKLASQGIQNISDRIVSRKDGEEIFIISVPLEYRGEVVGTLQKFFTPQEMYGLCSISLFSSEGVLYVINQEGYILISSNHDGYNRETENYFRTSYSQGNEKAVEQLQNDIKDNRSGFMETVVDGQRFFSAYTPLEEIHDWYLISSVATSAVSPNANIVIRMFYVVLSVVVLVFGLSLFFFLIYKKKQQSQLERVAFEDSVTNGKTFNKFVLDVQHVLQEHPDEQFYLLRFDIDNFKYVNNFYGFDFGNQILRTINESINARLVEDESVARITGDHFIVLLKNASGEHVDNLLNAIQNDAGIVIYFSAGVYTISNQTESVNRMVDKANAAARTVKGSLTKRIAYYSEQFDQVMIRNEQLKRSVKQALVDREIIPFYQPKVDINTGALVGAEALARWKTKEGKLVPPFEFIPMCEQTGMVTELDMAIFEQVLQFLRRSLDRNLHCVPISVNFSRLHLLNKDFMSDVMKKVEQYKVPTNLVEMELTESAIFDNYETIAQFIAQLHERGFSVSMDDFGSGYSSLNMLKDIPIDVLKIDKGFLNKTSDTNRQKVIFSAIAQMAQQLHISVVVEGVEFLENIELMKTVGCTIAQGYYFAKPMEESKFEAVYQEGIIC